MMIAIFIVLALAVTGLIAALRHAYREARELRQAIYDRDDRIEELLAASGKP